jgi:catechol 2,3-dioxygenase-like lactoylglutathione lyase family enzyme
MAIVPTVRCKSLKDAVAFYTQVLDFDRPGPGVGAGDLRDPGFCILYREGEELHLSSHSGDGQFGQAIAVLVPDVDALFAGFLKRGLDPSAKPQSPVHQGPTSQSWGTREFYVDDPSGNTLRFIERRSRR